MLKQIYTESQMIAIAEEKFCRAVNTIPDVTDIEKLPCHDLTFFDLAFSVHFSDGYEIRFAIDVKMNGERRYARKFINKCSLNNDNSRCVFVAPYISKDSGKLIYENGLSYMDLSGNCELVCERFYICVEGKTNAFARKKEYKSIFSITSSASSAVLRTMLSNPSHMWQVKELADKSGTALGTVSNVKSFLADRDWINEKDGRFRIVEHDKLMKAWAQEYHRKSSLSYEYYSLDPVPEIERGASLFSNTHDDSAFLAGFSAGARYAPAVRYNKVNVYVERQYLREFELELGLQKVDKGGNVIVTIPHDETALIDDRVINGDHVVSPVQTCIDLLGESSRGEEACDAIIRRIFE